MIQINMKFLRKKSNKEIERTSERFQTPNEEAIIYV